MNICFLGDVRSAHVHKFIQWFAEDNETHLISFDYIGDPRTQPGIEFFEGIGTDIHLLKKSLLPISTLISRPMIRKIKPDLVQCHFITNYGFLGAYSGVHPLVITAMGDDILIAPFKTGYGRLVRYALDHADMVTADGLNSIENLDKLGVTEEKRMLAYPGLDMQSFHPSKRVPSPCKTVFCPRGFGMIYDVDTRLEVIKRVHKALPHIRFSLLGVGTELERFRESMHNEGLDNVACYLGNIENGNLPYYLASADVSISCSLSDGGIPASTAEAMACGVPVVCTDAGDAREWVRDGVTGYVVPIRDAEALADRVIEILIDDYKRDQMGKNARTFVEHRYDYPTEMRKIEKMYDTLING